MGTEEAARGWSPAPLEEETVTRTVVCTWRSTHEVELPASYKPGGTLDEEWADQVDTAGAELVDWDWR